MQTGYKTVWAVFLGVVLRERAHDAAKVTKTTKDDKCRMNVPVAAGILPAVEPGFQPGGKNASNSATGAELTHIPPCRARIPGGRMPPSTAGKDACHYHRLWT